MKTLFPVLLILSLCFLVASCQGQVQTTTPQESTPPPPPPPQDYDPYFNGNEQLTSSFGPTTITRNILEDKAGNIWFGTWEGIVRYDGHSFTNLTNQEGLRRYRSFSLLEDKAGLIWFGTIGAGLYSYDANAARKGQSGFTNLTTEDGLVNNDVQWIYEDQGGNLWIGTRNGLSVYDGNAFRNFSTADGMPDADVNATVEDASGNLWIAARGEASIFDGENFSRLTREGGEPFINCRTMIKDQKGNIWLGGNDGLWCYDGQSFLKLDSSFIGNIYEDRQGNIWFSKSSPTSDYQMALYRLDAWKLTSAKPVATKIANPDGQVFGAVEDSKGNIWFGTEKGAGRFDGTLFEYFREQPHED